MSLNPPTPTPIITPDDANTINLKRPDALKDSKADTPGDREERAIASLLSRFKNLVSLAATKIEDGATKEVAAAHSFQMETESAALVGQISSTGIQISWANSPRRSKQRKICFS